MHIIDADLPAGRPEQLLQERLAVAHAASRPPRDEPERLSRHVGPLSLHDLREPAGDRRRVDGREIKPLAPRENRDREFFRLRRAEHKLHVRRRLFQRLEQRVEGLTREHVHFVDDVNLVAASRRADGDVLPQLADLVDAAFARGVVLDHIDELVERCRQRNCAGQGPVDRVVSGVDVTRGERVARMGQHEVGVRQLSEHLDLLATATRQGGFVVEECRNIRADQRSNAIQFARDQRRWEELIRKAKCRGRVSRAATKAGTVRNALIDVDRETLVVA